MVLPRPTGPGPRSALITYQTYIALSDDKHGRNMCTSGAISVSTGSGRKFCFVFRPAFEFRIKKKN